MREALKHFTRPRPVEQPPEPVPSRIAKLSLAALRAAVQAVSTEETRYWLMGVRVELGVRQTVYVTTTGMILFAFRDRLAELERDNSLTGAWTIPSETVRLIAADKLLNLGAVLEGEGADAGELTVRRRTESR